MQVKTVHAVVIICSITGISLLGNSLEVNAQPQEALKKYENDTLGISFQYSISAAILNEGIVRPIIELLT